MLKKQALLGVIGVARAAVGLIAATLIIRKYGIEAFGEVAFATTYMMVGTIIEAFMFPKLKADIVNLAVDESNDRHRFVETLNIGHSINTALALPALMLMLMVPVCSYLFPAYPSASIGITGIVLCLLLSGGAYVEQVYVANDKLTTYRAYDLLTWIAFVAILMALNNVTVPLPVLAILFLGGTAIFRQIAAINLVTKESLKTNFVRAWQFLVKTKSASFHFAQANVFGVGTSLLVNAFIKWHMGAKDFGEFSFLQKVVGAPFSLAAQNLGVVWRKYAALKLVGDTPAILKGFNRTIVMIVAITALIAPLLIYFTNLVAEFSIHSTFSLGIMAVFVLYGLGQLIFAWSSITCSIYEMFKTQRNAYAICFMGTCITSFISMQISLGLSAYMGLLTIVSLLPFIYSAKAIKAKLVSA